MNNLSFEELVNKYIRPSVNGFYYADYYDDNPQTKALLFSICHLILNRHQADYKLAQVEFAKKFIEKFIENNVSYNDCSKLVDSLKM